ncbi:MAG: molybdopterin-dependent oxidoreductase [Thermoproteota archaeon]
MPQVSLSKVTRRDFLKTATAVGLVLVTTGIAGKGLNQPFILEPRMLEARVTKVEVDKWVPSICPYCGCGCAILYGVKGDKIVSVRGDPEGWNKGRLCMKGASLADLWLPKSKGVKDRLLKPMMREPGKRGTFKDFKEVTWDEALNYIAEKLKEYTKIKAGDKTAFAIYGSGQVSTEYQYLQSKLGVIGLNIHADNNGRLCQATKVMGMVISYGIDAPPMSFDDVYHTDNLFIIGFNVAETLPNWFAKIVDAKVRRGADLKIVIVNPVRISATQILDYETGDRFIPIMPGTDVPFLNSIAYVVIYEMEGVNERYGGDTDKWLDDVVKGLVKPRYIDVDFIEKYATFYKGDYKVLARIGKEGPVIFKEIEVGAGIKGFREFAKFISKFKPEVISALIGVSPEEIRETAKIFVRGRNTMSIYLQGYGQASNGVSKHLTLSTLHVITGRIGRAGAGVMPTVGQPNGLGQRIGGAVVGRLPGNRNHPVPAHRASLAKVMAKGIPEMEKKILDRIEMTVEEKKLSRLAFTAIDMFKRIKDGAIKGVWIVCTNPLVSFPNVTLAFDALKNAELVVVQDIYWSETAAFADVLLPAAALSGESTGTFFNTERRVQILEKAVEPPGDSLPDEIIFLAFIYKYLKTLEKEGRTDEADFIRFLAEPFYKGYENLFENVQANIKQLREIVPEIQSRIFSELAAISKGVPCNDFSGLSYERLRKERDAEGLRGFQIPVPSPDHKGTKRLYDESYEATYKMRFATPDGKVRCFIWDYVPPAEWPDPEYPFILILPRIYEHWHTRTRTGRCALPHKLKPEPWISINPTDAAKLGVKNGDLVEVESKRGKVIVKVLVDEVRTPREGVVWMPWAYGFFGDMFVGKPESPPGTRTANLLSNDVYDPVSKQPELKFATVRIRKVS